MEGERERGRRGREKGGEEREGEKGKEKGGRRERGGRGEGDRGRRGGGGGQGEEREGGRRERGREGVICDNACRRIKWTVFSLSYYLVNGYCYCFFFFFFFFFNLSQFLSYRIFTASQAFIFCMCEFSILISQLCTLFLTTPVEFHTLLCDEG